MWEMFTTLACWNFGAKRGNQAADPAAGPEVSASAVGTLMAVPAAPSVCSEGEGALAGLLNEQRAQSGFGGGPEAQMSAAMGSGPASSYDRGGARQLAVAGIYGDPAPNLHLGSKKALPGTAWTSRRRRAKNITPDFPNTPGVFGLSGGPAAT